MTELVAGSSQRDHPDYQARDIPAKPPTEYSYVERRTDLLQQVLDLGHPSLVHQGEAAERYGVSQQQISKDLDRLGEYIEDNLGSRRDLITEAVYHRSIRGLLEQEEYRKAAQTVSDWNEYLTERHELNEIKAEIEEMKRAREDNR